MEIINRLYRVVKTPFHTKNGIFAIIILCSPMAFAKYGDVMEVNGNSKIPDGWVLIRIAGPTLMTFGKSPKLPTHIFTLSLMDVRCAEKGAEVKVLGNSPVPSGWVITKMDGPTTMSSGRGAALDDSAITLTIKCL